jgi:hypothetical protein
MGGACRPSERQDKHEQSFGSNQLIAKSWRRREHNKIHLKGTEGEGVVDWIKLAHNTD